MANNKRQQTDETINVRGIIIDPSRPIKDYYIDNVDGNMNLIGRMRSGYYNGEYLSNKLFFPDEADTFIRANTPLTINFENETQANMVAESIFKLLRYYRDAYSSEFLLFLQNEKTFDKPSHLYTKMLPYFVRDSPVRQIPTEYKSGKRIATYLNSRKQWLPVSLKHMIFDMFAIGLLQQWMQIYYILSPTSFDVVLQERLNEFFTVLVTKKKAEAARNRIKFSQHDTEYQELKYRWFYIQKFGINKYREIMSGSGMRGYLDAPLDRLIMDKINKREKDLVILEQKKDEHYWDVLRSDRAPWIKLVRKLRAARSFEEMRETFKQLKKWLPRSTGRTMDWLRSKEGLPIICPHVRDKIEMEIKDITDSKIHDFLLKYAGNVPLGDAYYCNICGEVLTYVESMESISIFERPEYHDITEGMRDFIWRYASQIVRSYVKFTSLKTNRYINSFITDIVASIYDVVVSIDKKISKSKTNSNSQEIENLRKFYTIIYAWAAIIKVLLDNPTKVELTFIKVSSRRNLTNLIFNEVYKHIISCRMCYT